MTRLGPVAVFVAIAVLAGHDPGRAAGAVRLARGGHALIRFDLQNGHVWVRGVIGGSDSLWIVVDTGAASSAMDDALAKTLGLEQSGHHETLGAGGTQPSSSVSDVTIAIADLSIHRERLDTVDFGALSAQGGHPMQLVLGYELFESCIVRFDYAAGVMDVWDAAHASQNQPGVVVPMMLEENHPYVEGALKVTGRAPLRGRFVIDTGSNAGLILAPDVAERESLARSFPRTLQAVGRGVGGERRNQVGRAESFALGELRFDRPLVVMPDPAAGRISAPGTMGNIGGPLLGRCRVTFDYPRRRVRFERGAGFDRPSASTRRRCAGSCRGKDVRSESASGAETRRRR
jgi:predicted aspartyl protease